jgi:hypothetical protein
MAMFVINFLSNGTLVVGLHFKKAVSTLSITSVTAVPNLACVKKFMSLRFNNPPPP